jgi:hypothetical protein
MLVDLGNVQKPGKTFHDLFQAAISLPVLCRHELYSLSQSLVAFGQFLQPFFKGHDLSVATLLQHVNALLRADLLEDLRPDAHRDLAQVRLAQQEHEGP